MKVLLLVLLLSPLALASGSLTLVGQPETAEECSICVSFMGQAINELLNIIVNLGVIGTCGDLCGELPNQLESTVCDLLCDYVGIEGFIALVQDVDPDPIWICEELTVCPIKDDAKANIASLSVSPPSGAQGTTFNIDIDYQVTSEIGTGEVAVAVIPPAGFPFGDSGLVVDQAPGSYGGKFSVKTQPNEQEPFSPGNYKVQVAICEGSCGSSHSHTYTLSVGNTDFTISQ